ncbi:MAG TPA: carbohydrate ABC transporter permease [Limnochordia bacterium]|nr:carbohydrate ABC transporter permease [Limnochordia bacterium]
MALVFLIPFGIVAFTSVKSQGELIMGGVLALPKQFRWSNFVRAWEIGKFGIYFKNSGLLLLIKVPLGIFLAALAAYPLAKMKFRFNNAIFILFLLGLTIPVHVILIPMVIMVKNLGLTNTLWSLIFPYVAIGLPFQIFVMRGFFRLIPDELLEAARIDGASELWIFLRIMLPLSLPALATLYIIDAVATWNELLVALVLVNADAARTVPLGLLRFQGQFASNYTQMMAGVLIVIAPMIALYIFLQQYLIAGLSAGAVKE